MVGSSYTGMYIHWGGGSVGLTMTLASCFLGVDYNTSNTDALNSLPIDSLTDSYDISLKR